MVISFNSYQLTVLSFQLRDYLWRLPFLLLPQAHS